MAMTIGTTAAKERDATTAQEYHLQLSTAGAWDQWETFSDHFHMVRSNVRKTRDP